MEDAEGDDGDDDDDDNDSVKLGLRYTHLV